MPIPQDAGGTNDGPELGFGDGRRTHGAVRKRGKAAVRVEEHPVGTEQADRSLGLCHDFFDRLHPVEWAVGEAVGELVAFCKGKGRPPRQVRRDAGLLKDFQAGLTKAGVALEWPADVAVRPR